MSFSAKIVIKPSFYRTHYWYLTLEDQVIRLKGSVGIVATDELLIAYNENLHSIFYASYIGIPDKKSMFIKDGVSVEFDIQSPTSNCQITLRRPETITTFNMLLRFCWFALYRQNIRYDKYLKQIIGHFCWSISAMRRDTMLKLNYLS